MPTDTDNALEVVALILRGFIAELREDAVSLRAAWPDKPDDDPWRVLACDMEAHADHLDNKLIDLAVEADLAKPG